MGKFFKAGALLAAGMLTFGAAALGGCARTETDSSSPEDGRLPVVVSFNALKEFAQAVGQDKITVKVIIPDGTEPHDFEPKAGDLVALSTAKVFAYNGLGMEAWAEEAVKSAGGADLVVTETSDGVTPIANGDGDDHEEESEEEQGHDHGQYDPHVWLSLKGAVQAVENIRDALAEADPDNETYYKENAAAYTAELNDLYEEYAQKFSGLSQKNFVTGHAAFGYLCRDFGLEQNSVEDVFAEGEPSAKQLTELVKYCREHQVTTIFAEEMASPAVSQTLASEVGAEVKTIYTMESNEDDKTYFDRMKENLAEIYDSLK